MILKDPGETTLDAVERIGRMFSVNEMVLTDTGPGNISFLYELIGVLASEVKRLRSELPGVGSDG